jgi:two-component system, NtrC family, response regulator AtoC
MRDLDDAIADLARSKVPVLLVGEPGVGKKTAARKMHNLSPNSDEAFQIVPCALLVSDYFQRILRKGNGGTVYLDEVAELSPACQSVLLHHLASLEVEKPSWTQPRLVCGTAKLLEVEVKAGLLREDLYYRISGVCLRLPPIRQRRSDIPQLMRYMLGVYARDFQKPVPVLSAEAEHFVIGYNWPGNLRELADAARALVALGDEGLAMGGLKQRWLRAGSNVCGERLSLKQASRMASRAAERELILQTLDRTRWNRRRAAEELQISYKALLYKIKQIGQSDNEH